MASQGTNSDGSQRKPSEDPGTSMTTTVQDLAKEAIVTLPLGLIMSDSSQSSISDLSQLVTQQAVDSMYSDIQNVIDQPSKLLTLLLQNVQVKKSMTTNYNNLKGDVDTFVYLQTLINSTSFINAVTCFTYPNLFPGADTTTPWPNSTYIASVKQGSTFLRYYFDWSTGPFVHYSVWYPPYQMFVQDTKSVNLAILAPKILRDYSYSYTKDFLASTIVGTVWVPSLTPDHVTYSCSIGFDNKNALDPLLLSIKVTENTHVFLMDANTGILLSDSVPHSTFMYANVSDPSVPVIPLTPSTTNDTVTRDLGEYLKNKFGGNYSSIPNMNRTVSMESTIGGTKWIINYRYLSRPDNWLVVVGIPRSDFFSKTDSAQEKATILAAVLAAAGVAVTVFFAWAAMRPLQTLIKAMEKLTKMDFSALEGDILNERSFMLELRQLQTTFAMMCKAFASGIRKNKTLVTGSDKQRTKSISPSTNEYASIHAAPSATGNT
ncbi:hypothetical protein HDU76_011512 [Blyttiomyces sp. JEL0837]|nr:hypothetical protein HDU76_011512 [Blyttiomyces sp. JEL0837]